MALANSLDSIGRKKSDFIYDELKDERTWSEQSVDSKADWRVYHSAFSSLVKNALKGIGISRLILCWSDRCLFFFLMFLQASGTVKTYRYNFYCCSRFEHLTKLFGNLIGSIIPPIWN